MASITKRLTENLVANGYAQVANIAIQLSAVPLFLHFWHAARYGEWLVLSTIPTYFALAEAGFSSVAANEIAMMVVREDSRGIKLVLHTLFGYLLLVGGVLSALLLIAVFSINWTGVLRLTLTNEHSAQLVVICLGLYTIANVIGTVFTATYRMAGRYARGVVASSSLRLLELAASAVVLWHDGGIVHVALAWLLMRVIGYVVVYFDTIHCSPLARLRLEGFQWAELRRLLKPSAAFMAFPVGNAIYFQGITLTVNAVLGPSAVAIFNTVRTLTRVLSQAVALLKQASWPEFSSLYAAGDLPSARRLNRAIFGMSIWITVILSLLLIVFGPRVLELWTRDAIHVTRATLIVFLGSVIANGAWYVCSSVLMATNQHGALAGRVLAASVLAILITYAACRPLGLVAAPLGMLAAELSLIPYAIRAACVVLNENIYGLLGDAVTAREARSYIRRLAARFTGSLARR